MKPERGPINEAREVKTLWWGTSTLPIADEWFSIPAGDGSWVFSEA